MVRNLKRLNRDLSICSGLRFLMELSYFYLSDLLHGRFFFKACTRNLFSAGILLMDLWWG
ncbi:hypothetical protein Hdeb2414_s0009g00316001 [Helianthus debilis subsp. tardiflorus]